MSRFFYCRESRFVRRLAACSQRTGLRLGHLNSPRSPALSLLIKMFPRACRQKQPERRLFLLSASPHPPITKTGESRFFYCRQSRFVRRLAACPQRTGLRLGHLNSPRSPALSLLIKMFPRACRQKQPECRLFLLSASPHPPITKTGESRFFLIVVRAVSSVALRLVLNGRDYGLGI